MGKKREYIGCIFLVCIIMLTVQTFDYGWSEMLVRLLVFLMGASICVGISSCFCGKMKWGIVDVLMLAWWMYVLLCVYLRPSVPCAREIVTYTALYLLYIVLRLSDTYFPVRGVDVQWILQCAVVYELSLGLWQVLEGTSRHPLYPVTGSFFNPGPYTALIAMGMLMAIYELHLLKKNKIALGINVFVLVVGSLMIALTRSRSGMVVVATMVLWHYRLLIRRYWWQVLVVLLMVGVALFALKYESAMGRIVLWWQSACIWLAHPFLGAGSATFMGEYGCQLEVFFSSDSHVKTFAPYADVTEFAFCDLLQLLAEQGLVGGILCLSIVLLSLRKLYANERILFFAFIALIIFSLFSYPFQLLPYQIYIVVIVARAARYIGEKEIAVWMNPLLMAVVGVMSYGCHGIAKERLEANREYKQLAGLTHESVINDYYRLYPLCCDDKEFLFDFAKLLQVHQRYLDSNAMLCDGILVSNDPMFWVVMGNNYREMKLYDHAVGCYDTAFRRMPNRLYPLYQKMLLFQEMGNKNAMLSVAKNITMFQEKISSPAVEEMKSKARNLLNQK